MALTKQQIAAREGKLTASGVGVLMTGNVTKIHNLWRELTGDPTWSPEDLSDVWAVRLGEATEQLHLDWLATKLDIEITSRGEVILHPEFPWAACTLDGWADIMPVEVKHVNGFENRDAVVQRYFPQLTWIMLCTGARQIIFSVIEGAREPIQEFIKFDEIYAAELFARARTFMAHVWNLTEPVDLPPVADPVSAIKEYDYSQNNLFVDLAADWLETRYFATKHERTKKRIKEIIPSDAQRVFGGGIEVVRDRANRLNIVEKRK
jgi:hypothetical protein